MGIQSLRKFVEGLACVRQLRLKALMLPLGEGEAECEPAGPTSALHSTEAIEHLLFDLNSLIHSCYGMALSEGLDPSLCASRTIELVKERLGFIIANIVKPTKSLTIVLDGPAPWAKLRTQRLRRRRLSTVNLSSEQFSDLSISTGSVFLLQLEHELVSFFQENYNKIFSIKGLSAPIKVYIHGSAVPGEGEAKISRMLAYLALQPDYSIDDNVVIIGNDIDLVLSALGSTQYHNIFILGASSHQVICVGDIISRWLGPGGFPCNAAVLASVRIDLIFLFLLNGGDHYNGLGDAAAAMWRRYCTLRITEPTRALISNDLKSLDISFMIDIVQASEYAGDADAKVGLRLLKAALWATATTVSGCCPNYRAAMPDDMPTVSNIKAALLCLCKKRFLLRPVDSQPLTPLAAFAALMPGPQLLPKGLRAALRTEEGSHLLQPLQSLEGYGAAAAAERLVALAIKGGLLSPGELSRNRFASPVCITIPILNKRRKVNLAHTPARVRQKLLAVHSEARTFRIESIEMPTKFQYIVAGAGNITFSSVFNKAKTDKIVTFDISNTAIRKAGLKRARTIKRLS